MSRYVRHILNAVLLLFIAATLQAQSNRGAIVGAVTDPTGAPVPDVDVTAVNSSTSVSYHTRTSSTGDYSVQQLPEGTYKITIEKTGFKTFVDDNVSLRVAQTLTVNATMQIGQVNQSVEVTAAATNVQANTSEIATAVTTRMVMDLPLSITGNMRNPESFMFLTPGVTGTSANTQINGSQSRSKEVLLDGIGSTSPESGGILFSYPSVEAISEFELLGSDFNAEYGRTGGGFEIFTTRSGTNQFHGSLFDYLRNNVFDARGFFSPITPINRQNEYGAVFGGPVWIPKLYKGANRTFFHFVWSGFRYRQGAANNLISIPPLAFRQGDFSGLLNSKGQPVLIYDPASTTFVNTVATRQPFPNNQIPPNRISAVSSKILAYIPTPINGNLLNNYLAIGATQVNRDQVDVKIDHNFSDRNRINGFFYEGRYPTTAADQLPQPLSYLWVNQYNSYWLRIGHDFILSPNKVNHLGLGFTREGQYWHNQQSSQDWAGMIGLSGVSTGAGRSFPYVNFSDGYSSWANTGGAGKSTGEQINETYQITDSFSWLRANHSIKFGVDIRWLMTNGADFFNSEGTFNFSPLETALPTASGSTGNSFASFLLGAVDSATRNVLGYVPSNRYHYVAGYIQDDWKATRRLTVNYGLRYEVYFPRTEAHSNLAAFDPTIPNPAAGGHLGAIAFLGSGPGRTGKTSFADIAYKNFGPRLAVAYAFNDKTAAHAGYGIYYAPGNADSDLRQSQNYNYGFSATPAFSSTNAGVTPAFYWDNGFPTNFALPPQISPTVANGSNVFTMYPGDGRPPYFQNWTVNVQREIGADFVLDASYIGIKGTHLGTGLFNLNQLNPSYLSLGSLLTAPATSAQAQAAGIALPYPGFTGSVAQALRPYPQYLNITDLANPNGDSTYNALQVKLQKRLSFGLSLIAAYTWSKSLSNGEVQAGGGPAGQDYYNQRLEKAISQDDVPQNLQISYLYELPFGPGRRFLSKGTLGKVVGGWTFTGIQQYESGTPIVLTATNTLPLFNQTLRPNVVAGVPLQNSTSGFDPNKQRYINTAAFTVPPPFTFGTAARSYTNLRNPPFFNESFGLIKRTALTERINLTFRAEFFNVFNRVQFGSPAANVSASNFGVISSQANTPRQGQVALRLDF